MLTASTSNHIIMKSFSASLLILSYTLGGHSLNLTSSECRNIPGSAAYPNASAWTALNDTISGRLVDVVPSAKFCASLPSGPCTDEEWTSALFRITIPGALDQVNLEQDYDASPPSLCLRNGSTCGQGNVPTYSAEAEEVADIQAAVKFASAHNLRLAVKSSGHDYLGRSTAPNSLLIRTANLKNISFTESFFVGGENLGPAVTIGSGVHAQDVYQASKVQGKIVVTGAAATVTAAGGYVQGAGHSTLSPMYGLAADNVLEFNVVVASGELLQVNNVSHPDLFYAMRGGGAGSWGVIASATFKTYPTFNMTKAVITLAAANASSASAFATVHAEHIFDFDSVRAGQYVWVVPASTGYTLSISIMLPNTTISESQELLAPLLNASLAIPGVSFVSQTYVNEVVSDALYQSDDSVGQNLIIGSRLIPAATYIDTPAKVGDVHQQLLDAGFSIILTNVVAGGQVSANANISSAVHPAWRTAKNHLMILNQWTDDTPLDQIDAIRHSFQNTALPIVEQIAGPNAGAYSNEADMFETDFKSTFFGPNYAKLSAIKTKYDPTDLFIVASGVGSERWDEAGMCTV
ncbi:FAD-binding domain-containing protein [Mycena vitilis]|nr:FAD-binding domain-containing protein [Mycena vitilis]